jgi:hypothetical protein
MRIAVIDNQALFVCRDLLRASRHSTAPRGAIVNEREREYGGRDRHFECV